MAEAEITPIRRHAMTELPPAPETPLDADGDPRFGTYRGQCRDTDLTEGARRLGTGAGGQFLREKQWQWFAAVNSQLACGGTLLDAGYATVVFVWIFDRTAGRMLVDETDVLPPFAVEINDNPSAGGVAQLRGLSRRFAVVRDEETIDIDVSIGSIHIDLVLDSTETEALTAICPVGEGDKQGVNVTQKQTCLPARGRIAADGRAFEMRDGSLAMLDYSHGLLGRETRWRWAIGCGSMEDGTPIGFNFVQGFNGELENAIWMDGGLRSVEPVTIEFDETRPRDPWSIRTDNGALDLSLFVEGLRDHETNFRIVSSSYLQPLGRCHGRVIDREVHDLFAIAERHTAKW